MHYSIDLLSSLNQKSHFRLQIEAVFQNNFYRKLSNFNHFFLKNPYGSTIVAGLDQSNTIVGLGHIIYFENFYINQKKYNFYLFTTSIIDKKYRKTRLYFDILDAIKEQARLKNVDFILAFPNLDAFQVMKTFGGFQIANVFHWLELDNIPLILRSEKFLFNEKFISWRLSRHTYFYTKLNNLYIYYKDFNHKIDILSISEQDFSSYVSLQQKRIDKNKKILISSSFLCNQDITHTIKHTNHVLFYPLEKNTDPISFTPIFSDVF